MSVLVALQGAAPEELQRTVGDTLAGDGGFLLLLSDGGISEDVSQTRGLVRSTADTVAAISETTVRQIARDRTTADTLEGGGFLLLLGSDGISETVAAIHTPAAGQFERTAIDSLGDISEAVTRAGTADRTTSDALGAIDESVGEDAVGARTVEDVVTPIAEDVSRSAELSRSTADTVGTISEAVVGVHTPAGPVAYERTAADGIDAITEAITEPIAPVLPVVGGGGVRLRPFRKPEPVHLERTADDTIEFIYEHIDTELDESVDWLIEDLLVLA